MRAKPPFAPSSTPYCIALDQAEGCAEAVRAAGTDVHLLDDRAVAPPFRDQLQIRPEGEDVLARGIEVPFHADLELARGADGGLVQLSSPPA
jgi:hypothetical protein